MTNSHKSKGIAHIAKHSLSRYTFMTIMAFSIITVLVLATVAHAEDDEREDRNEREEREDDREDDDDSHWEFDDDFKPVVKEKPPKEIPVPIVNITVNQTLLNATVNETLLNQTIIVPNETPINYSVNVTPYLDDDNDGVANKDDKYPGKDDLALQDSDSDGFNDRADLFPGKNDLDYMDQDHDGVIDSKDSDTAKATDKDHDGVDNKFDTKDDRSALAKILGWLGMAD